MGATRIVIPTLGLAALMFAAPFPVAAEFPRALLYEVVEEVKEDPAKRIVENAILIGKAPLGTPPCPDSLAGRLPPDAKSCDVILQGWDNVDNLTGIGTFGGKFKTMVQGDNAVDGSEVVALTGDVQGVMDSSPVRTTGHPFGTVTGKVTVTNVGDFPMTGVFRMPFDGSYRPAPTGPTLRELFCPRTPSGQNEPDYVYVDTTAGWPNGRCIDIRSDELMFGVPMVRFEVSF